MPTPSKLFRKNLINLNSMAKPNSRPINLGAEQYGRMTGDKRNLVIGRDGHAVALCPPLVDAEAVDTGTYTNWYHFRGLPLALPTRTNLSVTDRLVWQAVRYSSAFKSRRTPLVP